MNPVPTSREIVAQGATCLTDEGRDAIATFVLSHQCSDGGFSGRSASSDLYYALFAAAILDGLGRRRTLLRLPRYLKQFGDGIALDFVHLTCLAQLSASIPWGGRTENILAHIETFRSRDGGYSHTTPDADTGSAYAMYLAVEAYAGAHCHPPRLEMLRRAIETLRTADGGYTNEVHGRTGHVNATAAVCIVRMRLGMDPEPPCAEFLLSQFDGKSGGFHAYPSVEMPDLLSTASALYALKVMGVPLDNIAPQCRAFVESLWTDEGGFCGVVADPVPDCEYTCYALMTLGALL